MNFNIEKGIPLKKEAETIVKEKFEKIPLSQMVKGDSVFIPNDYISSSTLRKYFREFNTTNNNSFTTKKENNGIRIFKIK